MESGRPAWIECEVSGRIAKPTHELNYPDDLTERTAFCVAAVRAVRAVRAPGETAPRAGSEADAL